MASELRYEPLERLRVRRPVDRVAYVVDACAGKRVLDLGCLDETAPDKRAGGEWLHGRIAEVAAEVLGVDSSPTLADLGTATSDRSRIVRGSALDLAATDADLGRFDVVVAGELVEHLADVQAFLGDIKRLFAGKALVFTTPNATSLANVVLAVVGRESNHRDHVAIYSYKTLTTLCRRAGFERFDLVPYHTYFTEMALRNPGMTSRLVRGLERVARTAESLVPLLSFGWIVHVERI